MSQEKRAAVTAALAKGLITLTVNCNERGVRVPDQFSQCSALMLNVSYRFKDVGVIIDAEKIGATLTFSGAPFRCIIPWTAVWAMTSHGMQVLWGESMPEQAVEEMQLQEQKLAPRPRHLRPVPN